MQIEQLERVCPAAFAMVPSPKTSGRYAMVHTDQIIEKMYEAGYEAVRATQQKSRSLARVMYARHHIVFQRPGHELNRIPDGMGRELRAEVHMLNAHDGSTRYKLIAGLLRVICTNGLVVGAATCEPVSILHSGDTYRVLDEVLAGSQRIMDGMHEIEDTVTGMLHTILSFDRTLEFLTKARDLRWATAKWKPEPLALDVVHRGQDQGADLWHTFNRAQEALMVGNIPVGPRRARALSGDRRSLSINMALWNLAKEYIS